MAEKKTLSRVLAAASISVGLLAASAPGAFASEWEFTLSGVFNGTTSGVGSETIAKTDGTGGPTLTANEPFTMTAVFNDQNVVTTLFPGSGTAFYAPQWVTLSIGGQTYDVQTYGQDPTSGLTVALFDKSNAFGGSANHVAAGFVANPVADGAGIVGDWFNSTPNFLLPTLVNTQWTNSNNNYFGVGFQSGPCPAGTSPNADVICEDSGNNLYPNAVVPIPLNGTNLQLTLGLSTWNNYDLNNSYNINYTPPPGGWPNLNDNVFTASLTSVPEPSTWALLLFGFAGLGMVGLRRLRTKAVVV